MRPKKPRFIDGVQLADNLYPDNKKRAGRYRYKRPDGSYKGFATESVEEANMIAEDANSKRHIDLPVERRTPLRDQLAFHVPQYIEYQEKINPDLKRKKSWGNRRYALHQFKDSFPQLRDLTHQGIRSWWDELTYHQQKLRMAAFRAFFNWLMAKDLTPKLDYNPFTTADDKPKLLLKAKPMKQRRALTQEGFKKIHKQAGEMGYEALQIAMDISRYTTLREGDVCRLKWSDIQGGELRVVISKSVAQKGSARATRHKWTLANHPSLKRSIDRARELSLQHKRCPFIVSHKPRRRVWNESKEHLYQVTADRLSRMFAEARDKVEIKGTTFHEVRGLSATLMKKAGYTNNDIQNLMAHESVITTIGYQDASELPYNEVELKLES